MSLQGKPVTEVTEQDLRRLIADRVRESQTLDYKRESYGRNDDQIREMLRDISAMASAFGGDLLIGVEEDDESIASDLYGIENAEEEAQRIVSSCLSNIQERVPGLVAWPVPLSTGRSVIVVRVPQSLRAPHMVTFRGINQFWARRDRQKTPLSVYEIKETCLKVERLMEKLERFIGQRKQEIREKITASPYFAMSVTPLFVDKEIVDFQDTQLRNLLTGTPGSQASWNVPIGIPPQPTLSGLKSEYPGHEVSLELFRNGHIELLLDVGGLENSLYSRLMVDGQEHPIFYGYPLVKYPLSLFRLSKEVYSYLGITDSVVVSLSLYNIQGFGLAPGAFDPRQAKYTTRGRNLIKFWEERKTLEVPLRQVPSLERPEEIAKEVLDRIWQAFGHDQAPLFDAEGNIR